MVRQGLLPGPRRAQERDRRGDQEGVPEAGTAVPPGREPRQQGRGGTLQGDLERQRRRRATRRSARATTRSARWLRPATVRAVPRDRVPEVGREGRARSTTKPPISTSAISCAGSVVWAVAGGSVNSGRNGGPTSKPRSRSRSTRRWRGRPCRSGSRVRPSVTRVTGAARNRAASPMTCPTCGGAGSVSVNQGFFSMERPCPECRGSGRIIEHPCPTCHGTGAERRTRKFQVKIHAGVKDGARIKLAGRGEPGPAGGHPGDLLRQGACRAASRLRPQG